VSRSCGKALGASLVTVELARGDLPGGDQAVEEQERGIFAGQRALRLDAPTNSSFSRSMTFVVRRVRPNGPVGPVSGRCL
jgi:hypothetical protein